MENFVKYIANFANEGETALFIKQIVAKSKHKDGSIKHVWPAYLPSKWKDDGSAWYGNTGLFISDRFKDGKPSASASCVEFCGCMVLDDVGTKSTLPPVEPTWKMETSPGNYQYGYTLNPQPRKGEFSAAIIAIAAAGYTDPGAINPVRNFRLPGSANLKPSANGFVSRLVEFNPDREFDLAALCEAFGVTPAPADTASHAPIALADNGGDDVFAWLGSSGMVLEGVNAAGWAGVVCPNHEEHSDGNPMGRYSPVNRAYCCLHAHCGEWDTERFLMWVADQGGPDRHGGLRDDLLAAAMQKVYDKIAPGDRFSEATNAGAAIEEVERREMARLEKDQLHGFFAYIEPDDAYFDLTFRREYKRKTFDSIYRHFDTRSIFGKSPRVLASIWFDENRSTRGGKTLAGVAYAPGEGTLCAEDGLTYGNKWIDARPKGRAGDVKPWLDLAKALIPDAAEREHIFNVFAYKRQHPNKKINHAVLLIGDPGIGKDSFYAPFLYSIGGTSGRNVHTVGGEEITSQFTYGLENEVLVLNELRQPEGKDRRAMENHLKPIIAAPPDRLTINRKGLHPYAAVNRILVLAGSNFDVPISLPSDDRRWFVVKSLAAPMSEANASRLWAWYLAGGFEAVAAWLQARDVSAFAPGARPPMTDAKAVMVAEGMSSAESYLYDLIMSGGGEFATGVVASPFHRLLDRLQGAAPSGMRLVPAALTHALKEAKWLDRGMVHSREFSSKKHIYCSPNNVVKSNSELRRIVEESLGGSAVSPLTIVK